jgi:hypothetical protein
LTQQAATTRAERRPNSDLSLASRGPREEQVSDVRAGDQQDKPDDREDNHQGGPHTGYDVLVKRNEAYSIPRIILLVVPYGGRDYVHFRFSLPQCDTRLQSPDHREVARAAKISVARKAQRRPKLGSVRVIESGGRDADHLIAVAIQCYSNADDIGVGVKTASP